jgi:mono/diheme cytochrome c family protein
VCHGQTGQGNGITTQYGLAGVANYHVDRLREADDGDIYNTIANGKGQMAAYGHQVKVRDRWAIVAYIRVLQRAQYAAAADVPEPFRSQLGIPSQGGAQ